MTFICWCRPDEHRVCCGKGARLGRRVFMRIRQFVAFRSRRGGGVCEASRNSLTQSVTTIGSSQSAVHTTDARLRLRRRRMLTASWVRSHVEGIADRPAQAIRRAVLGVPSWSLMGRERARLIKADQTQFARIAFLWQH